MIEIVELEKSFNGIGILKGININIPKGSRYGLIGRSGTGKSTLLRCINALEDYDRGELKIDGVDIKSLSKRELKYLRRDIGMVFQDFSLLGSLNVYDNISLPLKCWGYNNNYINNRVNELAEVIGLREKIKSRPKELSGGQKQRVAIARALALNPKILLCDEATSALDPKTAQEIVQLLNNINKELGITLVTVTHQLSILKNVCDEVSILENGKIANQGNVNDIFTNKPESLMNLIGGKYASLPRSGVNIEIFLTESNSEVAIISHISRDLGVDCLIIDTNMELYNGKHVGSLVVNISDEEFSKVISYLDYKEFIWNKLK